MQSREVQDRGRIADDLNGWYKQNVHHEKFFEQLFKISELFRISKEITKFTSIQ